MAPQAEPDIPRLKKEKKERRGGALPFLYAKGAGSGAGLAPAPGLLPSLINFISSGRGIGLLTAAGTAGAVILLYNAASERQPAQGSAASVFPQTREELRRVDAASPAGDAGAGSLSYFLAANRDKAYREEASPGQVDEEPPPEEVVSAPLPAPAPAAPAARTSSKEPPRKAAYGSGSAGRASLGGGVGLAGGVGLSGGMMRKFQASVQALTSPKALPEPVRKLEAASGGLEPLSFSGSAAKEQLRHANRQSVQALGTTSSEANSFGAANAFAKAPASANRILRGPGSTFDAADFANVPDVEGGPVGPVFRGEEDAPQAGQSSDVSPWTADVQHAESLLRDASTLITVIGILAPYKGLPFIGPIVAAVQQMLFDMAVSNASTAAGLGLSIMNQHGQLTQGAMLTTGGAITTAMAVAALSAPQSTTSWAAVLGGIAGLAAAVAALISGVTGNRV